MIPLTARLSMIAGVWFAKAMKIERGSMYCCECTRVRLFGGLNDFCLLQSAHVSCSRLSPK
jgi:hypothetical protein